MSENRFVSGNIIIIYCNFVKLESNEQLPEHVVDRISVCSKIFERVMNPSLINLILSFGLLLTLR